MNFTAIDFETAHANYPCEIGLTKVADGEIIDSKSWLIKPACFPYMNPWNEKVHGISTYDVKDALSFEDLWPELKLWIDDTCLVAHNAAFDMRVLLSSLAHYDLAIPYTDYFCSVSLSRRVWKELPSHSLGAMSEFHQINFQHHRAGDDSKACALITLKAFEQIEAKSVMDGLLKLKMSLKKLKVDD